LSIAEQRAGRLVERVQHRSVRHIACLETVQRMVQGGWCSDDQVLCRFGAPALLTRDEGKQTVEQAVRLLTTPRFDYQLALVPTQNIGFFMAYWKVLDGRVLLETRHPESGRYEGNVIIHEQQVAGDFHDHFSRLWRNIPSQYRDRKQVARLLSP